MYTDTEIIKVNLMGRFQISCGDKILDEDKICSAKGIRLLTLLLLNRKKLVTLQEMEEFLSASNTRSESGNSSGYIKNLVYRMQNVLKQMGDSSYIISKYKSYAWNPEIPVVMDVDVFEDFYEKAGKQENQEEKKHCYEEALQVYRPMTEVLMGEYWMVSIDAYYAALRLEMVKNLAVIYEQEENWEDLIRLCRDTIKSEPLDDELRAWLLTGLIRQKKVQEALKEYENAEKVWNEQLGGYKPECAEKLYQEIMAINQGKDEEIQKIAEIVRENMEEKGAYSCEQGVFYQFCSIEARKILRKETESSLVLFTLCVKGLEEQSRRKNFVLKYARNNFRTCLSQQLRLGDVISSLGSRQFAALLSDCPYEDCEKVVSRVLRTFKKAYPNTSVEICYETARLGDSEKDLLGFVQ